MFKRNLRRYLYKSFNPSVFPWLFAAAFAVIAFVTVSTFVAVTDSTGTQTKPVKNKVPLNTVPFSSKPAYPATTPLELMASAVRLHVVVEYTRISNGKGETLSEPDSEGWTGSGVVYDKTDRVNGLVRSRILSANHVLKTPDIGSIEDLNVEFLGIQFNLGKRRVDSVKIELQTADGRVCNVKVLALGSTDQHDVATAEADCDAGRVAKLATAMPVMGEKVFVAGYSLSVPLPMLTEGYVSGWLNGYLLTSAPAFGGNSGGPVYHNGKVIGLLVRGSQEYPHLTLTASLEECLRRIAETPPL